MIDFYLPTVVLGTLKPNSIKMINFPYDGESSDIVKISPSCGCSEPVHDTTANNIIIKYDVGPFPIHLREDGVDVMEVTKTITVYDKSENKSILTFSATIKDI